VVRERVPDRVLDEADEVVVVDVTPETLEERLREGKIYAMEKVEQSLQNFFQRRNLIALRELALREVADNIEEDAIEEATINGNPIEHQPRVHERVLVCVSTEPNSVQLLRRGARIANYMNAPFYTLFVTNPDRFLTKTEALHIETCERLCKEFEGEFLRVSGYNVAEEIAKIAKSYRITQIVLGRSRKSRWKILLRGSFIDTLMQLLPQSDLHIIHTSR
jgi:two-component system sensor histidine kinase KdpD